MGYPIMFYASDDNRENLKSIPNRSELINDLLKKHFQISSIDNLPIDERIKILEEKKRIALIEMEAMKKIQDGRTI
jgi:hypothetical protein